VTRVLKYLLLLNSSLALTSLLGSAWVARTMGSTTGGSAAYWAGGLATLIVGVAASLALVVSFLQAKHSRATGNKESAVTGVLVAMLIRMGLPIAALIFVQQLNQPLVDAGFLGLLTLNYLFALPVETGLSLSLLRETDDLPAMSPTGTSPTASA